MKVLAQVGEVPAMRMPGKLRVAIVPIGVLALVQAGLVRGEVTSITGSVTALVVQYNGIIEIQRDFSQENVPQTNPNPPATARARLDHMLEDGTIPAAGQIVSLLAQPNLTGLGSLNDAGLDLGAYADDASTSWVVQGTVTERRTLVLGVSDLGGDARFSNRGRAKSKVVLSGAMMIMASDGTKDLSEVEVRLRVRVTQYSPNSDPLDLLGGSLALVGGPNGSIEVTRGPGAMADVSPLMVDLAEIVPGMPLVRAGLLAGVELPYEYEAIAGEAFDLEMSVETLVQTTPGGTGGAATFGMPQEGLPSLFQRVKQSDLGQRLADAIAERVDTTGTAYAQGSGASTVVSASPFPVCGVMGLETAAVMPMLAGCWLSRAAIRRRKSEPPMRREET
jgi:hypothetical protein